MPNNSLPKNWGSYIDHTLLKPDSTQQQIQTLCAEAVSWNCAAVCVLPIWVELCKRNLKGSPVKLASVADFPLGGGTLEDRKFQTQNLFKLGCDEVDIVAPIGLVKSGLWENVKNDALELMRVARTEEKILKIIFETGLLSSDEIFNLAKIYAEAGVNFLKTSTGFGPRGANLEDIEIFKRAMGSKTHIKIKASGGIRNFKDFKAYVDSGVHRIGTSATRIILEEANTYAN